MKNDGSKPRPLTRRNLIQASGAAMLAAVAPSTVSSVEQERVKRPTLRMLLERGKPEVYSGQELKFIGMPIGGLFAGTVYLGGDGQLWNWDIFNQERLGCVDRAPTLYMGDKLSAGGGANYVDPVEQRSPFEQRFELIVTDPKARAVRFGAIKFRGEYPVGKVSYAQADAEVEMTLEAFSPFCPLDTEASSFPATTQTYRITNVGSTPLALQMRYTADNPALIHSKGKRDDFELVGAKTTTGGIVFSCRNRAVDASRRPDVLFEDWSSGTYGKWAATGTSFGDSPRKVSELPAYMGAVNAGGAYVVNSHQTRNGEDVTGGDAHTGRLTSPEFTLQRKYVNLRVGGGNHEGRTCVNLIVGGRIVRTVTGHDSNVMRWESFPVSDLEGSRGRLEVVDLETGPWGNIALGEIVFSDTPAVLEPLDSLADFGTFAVEVVGGGEVALTGDRAVVGRSFTLSPGESKEVTFVVAWHFPNCARSLPGKKHWYASRWGDAGTVAQELVKRWKGLAATTRAWNRTWYDSTLPYWFLDRTFINTSILATSTCHRLDGGRYYFWEGIGCCPGTCTHVWGYAQAIGRLFPEIERYLRKEVDFGRAYHENTGAIDYRAEFGQSVAVDGQASCILRALREHQMSADPGFLPSIWSQVKGAMRYLMTLDSDQDGVLKGAQYNTLDTAWFGEIAWISSLYIAALRACEVMAREMSDPEFAATCQERAARGTEKLVADLFNGEYFVNKGGDAHPEATNTHLGCHIDQLYGQSWAHQVGLPRIVPVDRAVTALRSLYKYNFFDDVWEYRRKMHSIPGGRWYAEPGEPGLIMCSFPKGDAAAAPGRGNDAWAAAYLNECMTGFEYQAASHMIAEGLLEEGLNVIYAIHRRYQPSKRNPYNEVECSDHYGRAMASYGAFVTLCGFRIDGVAHRMSLSPKVHGEFRAPFINEHGWGVVHLQPSGLETTDYRFRLQN